MEKEKLVRLWFRRMLHKLTPAEEQELQQWCNESPRHDALLQKALNLHRIKRSLEAEQLFDEKKAWINFLHKKASIRTGKKLSIREMSFVRYAAAFAILLVSAATCYWALHSSSSNQAKQNIISPIYAACEGVTLSCQGKIQKIEDTQYNVEDTTIIPPTIEIKSKEEPPLTIDVAKGNSFKLILDDGTEVLLNSCSQITFPRHFHGNQREVTLTYGEAFFKVSHQPEKPFIVRTQSSSIQVLGTTFNVNAYADEHLVATTLIDGSVLFRSKNSENFILKPGMQSCMNTDTGETNIEKVDTSIYTAWLNGEFVFQSIDLPGIMRQIERWYDIETDFQNCDVNKYHFKGAFNRNLSLQQILEILSDATELRFTIEDKRITITQ